MLRHEQTQEQSFSAQPPIYGTSPTAQGADARVSPDELVAAISAIEARRSEKERWQAGTVALGEAVQQLGLNITPAELMAEIEKARNQQFTDVRIKAGKVQQRRTTVAVVALATLLFAIPLALLFWTSASREAPMQAATYAGTGNGVTAVREVPAELTQPKATNLSMLQDNIEAYITLGSVFELNRGKVESEISLEPSQQAEGGNSNVFHWQWTVVKHNGEAFLKGFAAKQNGKFTRVYSTQPQKMDPLSPVTIPLTDLKSVRDPSGVIKETRDPELSVNTIEYLELSRKQLENSRQ